MELDADTIPYAPEARGLARSASLPLAGFAFGGAGEYELLFTTGEGEDIPGATRIGTVFPDQNNRVGVYWNGRKLPASLPDARAFPDRRQYIRHLLEVVRLCTE